VAWRGIECSLNINFPPTQLEIARLPKPTYRKLEFHRVPKGGLWSPEIFVVEPGVQSLSRLGARTKMLFLPKWSPRALNFLSWSPAFFRLEPWSPGALNPFGTQISREHDCNSNL